MCTQAEFPTHVYDRLRRRVLWKIQLVPTLHHKQQSKISNRPWSSRGWQKIRIVNERGDIRQRLLTPGGIPDTFQNDWNSKYAERRHEIQVRTNFSNCLSIIFLWLYWQCSIMKLQMGSVWKFKFHHRTGTRRLHGQQASLHKRLPRSGPLEVEQSRGTAASGGWRQGNPEGWAADRYAERNSDRRYPGGRGSTAQYRASHPSRDLQRRVLWRFLRDQRHEHRQRNRRHPAERLRATTWYSYSNCKTVLISSTRGTNQEIFDAFQIYLKFDVCMDFSTNINITVQKRLGLQLRINCSVIYPKLKFKPSNIVMKRVSSRSHRVHEVSVSNLTNCKATIMFLLEEYPEFRVSYSKLKIDRYIGMNG